MSGQPKYVLVERIAQGGMAEIHLGKSIGSDGFARVCAFKRILPNFAHDNDFVQMFRQEAMVAKQLVNKNIVQVYDFQPDGESYVLVMEYIDGQDLRSVLATTESQKKRIPVEIAVYIAIETLNGLNYAHSAVDVTGRPQSIVHRDVSPQNILLSFDGDVKITDFGIAKSQNQSSGTRAGVLKGKFRYMSPEQAMGQSVNSQTDIFAMGVVLWEMVTMQRLFRGEDMVILELVRQAKIKPPSQVVGAHRIPAELDNIIMKMLKKDLSLRFETAREAVRELNRFLYAYRPEFFSGELSEFMQDIFKDKIEAIRQKMRTTLALPVGMEPENQNSDSAPMSQVLDLTRKKNDQMRRPGEGMANAAASGAMPRGNRQNLGVKNKAKGPVASSQNDFKIEVQTNQKTSEGGETGKPGIAVAKDRKDPSTGAERSSAAVQSTTQNFYPNRHLTNWRLVFENSLLWLVGGLAAMFLILSLLKSSGKVWKTEIHLHGVPLGKVLIEIDGNKMENGAFIQLPQKISIESGSKIITISRPGFKTKRLKLEASFFGDVRKETIVFEKLGKHGQVRIITNPPGATINLNIGDEVATSPHTFEYIPIRQKLIFTITHPKCSKFIQKDTLREEQEKSVVVRTINLPGCK